MSWYRVEKSEQVVLTMRWTTDSVLLRLRWVRFLNFLSQCLGQDVMMIRLMRLFTGHHMDAFDWYQFWWCWIIL